MTAVLLPGYGGLRPWGGAWLHLFADSAVPEPEAGGARAIAADERALARSVHGNPDRFHVLYDRYYERILNFHYRRVRDRALAEDLTSATFLAALEHLMRAERDVRFRPWIYRVATNVWLSHERRQARWGERFLGEVSRFLAARPVAEADRALSEAEALHALRTALMTLPPRYREPLLLRCDEDLADGEIAEALGLRPGTVRRRISRGIGLLRRRVRPLLGGTAASLSQKEDRGDA